MHLLLALLSALCAAPQAAAAPAAPPACNGHPELCGRPFNEVVYPATHNSMSSQEQGYLFPNQGPRIKRQLEDGVRALLIDLHKEDGKLIFCHSYGVLGQQDLVEGLLEIRTFMDTHPNEVISLLCEVYITPEEIETSFEAAGLARYAFAYKPGDPWPTLGDMIVTNKRLVVLSDRDPGNVPWLLPMWKVMWDTNWNIHQPEDFQCDCNRGKTTNPLFAINHFIGNPLPFPGNAEVANRAPVLYERAKRCWKESGRVPNFLTVDHYEVGELFTAVDQLNGLTPPPATSPAKN